MSGKTYKQAAMQKTKNKAVVPAPAMKRVPSQKNKSSFLISPYNQLGDTKQKLKTAISMYACPLTR